MIYIIAFSDLLSLSLFSPPWPGKSSTYAMKAGTVFLWLISVLPEPSTMPDREAPTYVICR